MKLSAQRVAKAIKKSSLTQQEMARSTIAYGLSLALPAFIVQCDLSKLNQPFNLRALILLQIDLFDFSLEQSYLKKAYKERRKDFDQVVAALAAKYGISSKSAEVGFKEAMRKLVLPQKERSLKVAETWAVDALAELFAAKLSPGLAKSLKEGTLTVKQLILREPALMLMDM